MLRTADYSCEKDRPQRSIRRRACRARLGV